RRAVPALRDRSVGARPAWRDDRLRPVGRGLYRAAWRAPAGSRFRRRRRRSRNRHCPAAGPPKTRAPPACALARGAGGAPGDAGGAQDPALARWSLTRPDHTVSALATGPADLLRRSSSAKSTGLIINGGNPPSRVVSAMMLRANGNISRGVSTSRTWPIIACGTLRTVTTAP